MSASQDNHLDSGENEAQGEDLLDQLVDSGRDSLEELVVKYERVLGAPSPKIGCEEADLFEDDSITDSQLLRYAQAPTQEEKPEGPAPAPEVEEISPSEPIDGIESQQPAPLRDGQDIIRQEDSILSPPSVEEIPLGQRDSREVEQGSFQSEPSEQEVWDFAQEMKQRASLLDTLDSFLVAALILRR